MLHVDERWVVLMKMLMNCGRVVVGWKNATNFGVIAFCNAQCRSGWSVSMEVDEMSMD